MTDLLTSEFVESLSQDICEQCNAPFRISEGCFCPRCGQKHWHSEYCSGSVGFENIFGTRSQFIETVHWSIQQIGRPDDINGVLLEVEYLPSPNGEVVGTVVGTRSSGKYAVVVGIAENPEQGQIRFWARNLERPRIDPVHRDILTRALHDRVSAAIFIEMIDPPAWEGQPALRGSPQLGSALSKCDPDSKGNGT